MILKNEVLHHKNRVENFLYNEISLFNLPADGLK